MSEAIEMIIAPRGHDIGNLVVRRLLPYMKRRHVGPFVFLDHFGPVDMPPGPGMNVRPHPHIGLATITYLFEGEILHRDSLGFVQPIRPGDVNWMVAGRGIVHSERVRPEIQATGQTMHGVQAWLALPRHLAEIDPAFRHHPGSTLPEWQQNGARLRLVAGKAYGRTAPEEWVAPMFYADADLPAGATHAVTDEYAERAVCVASGAVEINGTRVEAGTLAVLGEGAKVSLAAAEDARVMLLGGAPLDGDRLMWWNFVAADKARLEQAKADWREGRFGQVPGEVDFIPLPEN